MDNGFHHKMAFIFLNLFILSVVVGAVVAAAAAAAV